MKVRSKQLLEFLLEHGASEMTDEQIIVLKKEYKKFYIRTWKKEKALPKKELRPGFTLKEFALIKRCAGLSGQKPTTYCRNILLEFVKNGGVYGSREILQQVLYHISSSLIVSKQDYSQNRMNEIKSYLEKAELQLLQITCNDYQSSLPAQTGVFEPDQIHNQKN